MKPTYTNFKRFIEAVTFDCASRESCEYCRYKRFRENGQCIGNIDNASVFFKDHALAIEYIKRYAEAEYSRGHNSGYNEGHSKGFQEGWDTAEECIEEFTEIDAEKM